jgi:peptide/nickel transport system substrate-binding protein
VKISLFSFLKKIFQKKGSAKPLVSSHLDVALLKSIRKQPYPKFTQICQFKRFLNHTEKKLFQISLVLFLLGIFWFAVSFLNHYTTPVAVVGGDYTEGIVGAPVSVNPLFANLNDVDKDISRLVYSGLMKIDSKGDLVPDLAEKYSLSEDKKVYTFTLKKNVVWHDGQPFTSKDVKFTFDLIQNLEVKSPLAVSFQGVIVEVPDDYTVQFRLNDIFTPFPSSLTLGILPEHIWGDISFGQIRLAHYNLQPIGTGPFKFAKMITDKTGFISEYTLERFDRYYAGPAYLEHFSFHFFASYDGDDVSSSAIEALREQKVNGINFVPISLKDKVDRKHIIVYEPSLPQYTALFFNQKKQPVFADKDVRLALEHAIDREKIVVDTQKGDAHIQNGPILEGYPGYFVPSTTPNYSLETANTLLDKYLIRVPLEELKKTRTVELEKEWDLQNVVVSSTVSGEPTSTSSEEVSSSALEGVSKESFVKDGLDQEFTGVQTLFRKTKTGNMVTVRLLTVDTPEYRKIAELVAGFWQEVGIKTNVQYVSPKTLSRDMLRDRDYDVLLYGVILGSDPDQYPFWHSSQALYPGLNLTQYSNKAVDDILQKIRTSDDIAVQTQLSTDFAQKIIDDIPAIFLYSPTYHYAMSDLIKGVNLSRITEPSDRLSDVTKWYIKTKSQWGK